MPSHEIFLGTGLSTSPAGLVDRQTVRISPEKSLIFLPPQKENPFRGCSFCGGGEIRTHGPVAQTPVFKTGAFDHSATPPMVYNKMLCGLYYQKKPIMQFGALCVSCVSFFFLYNRVYENTRNRFWFKASWDRAF